MTTQRYVHAVSGVVDDIGLFPDDAVPDDYVLCPNTEVAKGWLFDGTNFSAPPPPTLSKRALEAYAASVRYAKEVGGLIYQGHPIATDEASQSKIGNAALGATVVGSAFATKWKGSDGLFFDLDQAGMMAMATAVLNFVNQCYALEAGAVASISDGTITTTGQVDEAFA